MHADPGERLERPQELVGVNLTFVIGKPLITKYIVITVCTYIYTVYMLETIIKMIALGPLYYFHGYWNM